MIDPQLQHLPIDLLRRFLMEQMTRKIVCAAVSGAHVGGYDAFDGPWRSRASMWSPPRTWLG